MIHKTLNHPSKERFTEPQYSLLGALFYILCVWFVDNPDSRIIFLITEMFGRDICASRCKGNRHLLSDYK
jgi:hypothetical protein